VRFVPHDFETPMAALALALRDAGLDDAAPVLTIWEGFVRQSDALLPFFLLARLT
jgi:O-methyltransferase involved in polyketide biosynthesis